MFSYLIYLFKECISFTRGLWKCKQNWVRGKMNEGVRVKLCTRPNVINTSINVRKIKFMAQFYIRFNHNLDEKS